MFFCLQSIGAKMFNKLFSFCNSSSSYGKKRHVHVWWHTYLGYTNIVNQENKQVQFHESPEGTCGFSKKAISKSLYRIVQSVLTD